MAIWFVTDTVLSLYFRVNFNAAINSVAFLAVMIPLVISRKFFFERQIT